MDKWRAPGLLLIKPLIEIIFAGLSIGFHFIFYACDKYWDRNNRNNNAHYVPLHVVDCYFFNQVRTDIVLNERSNMAIGLVGVNCRYTNFRGKDLF